jgi:hypothetical protein
MIYKKYNIVVPRNKAKVFKTLFNNPQYNGMIYQPTYIPNASNWDNEGMGNWDD